MFGKGKKYLYQQILSADDRACQVRTFDGRVLYTNAKGNSVFSHHENPFANLSSSEKNRSLQDLVEAYYRHLTFETTIQSNDIFWEIILHSS